METPESAKLLCAGSIPAAASKNVLNFTSYAVYYSYSGSTPYSASLGYNKIKCLIKETRAENMSLMKHFLMYGPLLWHMFWDFGLLTVT